VLQNQGNGSIVVRACALRVDLLNTAAGEGSKLLHDCAVHEDAEAAAAHCAMLQRSAIYHYLSSLICRALECGRQWHLIVRPRHVKVGDVLDAERDTDEHVWTLQPHPVDGIVHGLREEIRLACRMWGLRPTRGQRVRKSQGSAEAAAVTVTTVIGHVSTVVGHGSASHDPTSPRSSVGQVRSRRCSRAGCPNPATSTLTYAYRDSTAVLGPLANQVEPHGYDLCRAHAQTLSAPRGWEVIRLTVEEEPKPSTDDLLALADAVRDAGLAFDPPTGSMMESPPQRHGLVELARRGHLTVLADPGAG